MTGLEAQSPLTALKGVGPQKALVLQEAGLETVEDLVYYFPRRYIDRSLQQDLPLQTGSIVTVLLVVDSSFVAHGRSSRLMVQTHTPTNQKVTLVWFRRYQFYQRQFERGQTLIASGKLEYYGGLQIAHPEFEIFDEEDEKTLLHVGRIIPLYRSTEDLAGKGFDSRGFRRLLAQVSCDWPEILPTESGAAIADSATKKAPAKGVTPGKDRAKKEGTARKDALQWIHFPPDEATLEKARNYLKYEELFLFLLLMQDKARQRKALLRSYRPLLPASSGLFSELQGRLPFALTAGQEAAIREMAQLCQSEHTEAFLLQGDVGSGKTIVALLLAALYIEQGLQVAFLAPTDVLARQHFQTLSTHAGLLSRPRIELLTGQGSKKERAALLAELKTGAIDLLIGTHALLSDDVVFKELALVIIDEQHRFGVEQREKLLSKGKHPDTLAMTATPIPRTLCLTAYADLRLLLLKEKPAGRKPIQTLWLKDSKREGLHKSIRKYVKQGRQCFVVYPVIEESEKTDLKAATDGFAELQQVFPDFQLGLLHGRLPAREKEAIMRDFVAGRIQILVSTTIIEVGVDVPNATIIVIEHAERFGISQLHQMRGRVGRGAEESFCIFMTPDSVTPEADERLKALVESQDGFYLADVDLKLRGPGELLGLRQHGLPGLQLADLHRDQKLAQAAFEATQKLTELTEAALALARRRFRSAEGLFGFT